MKIWLYQNRKKAMKKHEEMKKWSNEMNNEAKWRKRIRKQK